MELHHATVAISHVGYMISLEGSVRIVEYP